MLDCREFNSLETFVPGYMVSRQCNYYSKSSECTIAAHYSENGELKYVYLLIH